MNWDKFLSLDIKKSLIIFLAFFLGIIIHNGIYALFNFEEPVFLILSVIVIPLYFFFSLFYTLGKWMRKGGLKELLDK